MLSNILNNREVRRYRRHIVARSPGVKGQRKGEPPKLCSYCRKPFRVGESRIQKRYKVGEDEIVAYFDENYMDSTETPGVRFALRRQGYQI